jgi:hypothetical protein
MVVIMPGTTPRSRGWLTRHDGDSRPSSAWSPLTYDAHVGDRARTSAVRRAAACGSVLLALGLSGLAASTALAAGSPSRGASSRHGLAQETPTPTPTDEPQPSDSPPPPPSPSPSRSATPRPTCTIVCPPITPAPSASRTRSPSASPTDEPQPTESERPGSHTPDPLLTPEEKESTKPEPVLPTISVSPVPVSQPSYDGSTSTADPTASPEAKGPPKGRSVGSLFALAGLLVVVLGGLGITGLYLTRDPGAHR